ncbi:MAG: hypothetical protein LBD03_09725 [Methanobrevibacter sp.]|jgi:hypothetical protein|nr:hypothetical protein [Candidatus Methanovirga procula]
MFKKFLSLMIIVILAVSCISGVVATDKSITVHARAQNNDGDGELFLYDDKDDLILQHALGVKKGETITINMNYYPNLARIAFHSPGRNHCYNCNLKDISNFYSKAWDGVNDLKFHVNFYKKAVYYNVMFPDIGWYDIDGEYHTGEVTSASIDYWVQKLIHY